MNGFMHFTKRERFTGGRKQTGNRHPLHILAVHTAFMVPLVLLFTYMGPFGTLERMDTVPRLIYWSVAIPGVWMLCYGSILLLLAIMRENMWVQLLAIGGGAALAAIPGAAIVDFLETTLADHGPSGIGYYYPSVLAVALVLSYFLTLTVERHRLHPPAAAAQPEKTPPLHEDAAMAPPAEIPAEMPEKTIATARKESPATDPACPFFRRLPQRIGQDLVHVSVEDHYVHAVTTAGREMILMRFRDALAELEMLDGLQVHRSHWVAAAHVITARREGSKTVLQLDNGTEIPVSRAFRAAIRQRGWL